VARDLARRVAWAVILCAGVGAVVATAALARVERRAIAADLARERDLHGGGYAGSGACRRCHQDHYRSWHRTFHRTMTQAASPDDVGAVLGDFSGDAQRSRQSYGGVVARMDRDASGAFRMTFASERNPTRPPVVVMVSRAIGSRRYQQYLTRVGDAEYRLPVAWHVEEQRWIHMNGAFLFADPPFEENRDVVDQSSRGPLANPLPAEPREGAGKAVPTIGPHATTLRHPLPTLSRGGWGEGGGLIEKLSQLTTTDYARHVTRWNDNCVFCHNVAPHPARDPVTGAFNTTVAEMGVACEACHGPGAAHARANADPFRRYALHLGAAADPTIVNPSRLSPARSADLCGRCHGQRITDDIGRFLTNGDPFVPGDDLALWSAPLWQDTPMRGQPAPFAARFWPDGTARLTAYEYQGLLQSPCTQRGPLTCTSCHGMHEGDPRGQLRAAVAKVGDGGDGACVGCHRELAGAAAVARHSHHAASGAGARCVDCHMPRIVYGVLDIHRSHRIEVPDPGRAQAQGSARPDACTLCHVDESAQWAADAVARLWGSGKANRELAHVDVDVDAEVAVDADGMTVSYATRVLSGDPIERAVAADALGRAPVFSEAARAARAGLLVEVMTDDAYPAVRHLAARALGRVLPSLGALAASFDPTGDEAARHAAAASLASALPAGAIRAPDPSLVRRLRTAARVVAIDIGE